MSLVCSQPGCWNFLKIPWWSYCSHDTHASQGRASEDYNLFPSEHRTSLGLSVFCPFWFLKRRLSYLVIWQCLIATTLGIKWKTSSTNRIVTELLVTEKASVLDLSSVTFAWLRTAFCDMWLFKLPFCSVPAGRGTLCLPWPGQNLWEFLSSPEIFFPLDLLLQL